MAACLGHDLLGGIDDDCLPAVAPLEASWHSGNRRGKIFYSCGRYPDCQYALWNEPLAEPCPSCGFEIISLKTTKTRGTEKVCPQKDCKYVEKVESADDN